MYAAAGVAGYIVYMILCIRAFPFTMYVTKYVLHTFGMYSTLVIN